MILPITILVAWGVVSLMIVGVFLLRRRTPDEAAERVVRALAGRVADTWHAEAAHRGVDHVPTHPRLLHTQWGAGERELADERAAPTGHAARREALVVQGSTADMKALAEAFKRLRPQRLIILGSAASGKSTLSVLLLLELLADRADSDPVPMIFSMNSYDPERHDLLDWLGALAAQEYGEVLELDRNGRGFPRRLLETGRILPILDGLDEIPRSFRVAALRRINLAFRSERAVIITCRTEEYLETVHDGPLLPGAAVTVARVLAFEHVLEYLRRSLAVGPQHGLWACLVSRLRHGWGVLEDEVARAREQHAWPEDEPVTWAVLARGAGLTGKPDAAAKVLWARWSELVRLDGRHGHRCPADDVSPLVLATLGSALASPLMVTLFVELSRYAESDDEDIFDRVVAADPHNMRTSILDAAITTMFRRRIPRSRWPDAERHLVFLARWLKSEDRTVLAWWQLARAVSPWVHGGVLGLLLAVAGGMTTTAAVGSGNGVQAGFELGVCGLLTGTFLSWAGPERIASFRKRGGDTAGRARFARLSTGLAVAAPMGLTMGIYELLSLRIASAPVAGLLFALLLGVPAGVLGAGGPVRGPRWRRRAGAESRDRARVWRYLGGGTGLGALVGVPVGLVLWLAIAALGGGDSGHKTVTYVLATVIVGVMGGAVCGLCSGLLRWLQVPTMDSPLSPRALLEGDRLLVAGWGLVMAALLALPVYAVMPSQNKIPGLVLIAVVVLWVPIAIRTWPRYVIARCWLALRGELPRDLMAFFEEAYRVGAFRQIGGVYEFRHSELLTHLSGK